MLKESPASKFYIIGAGRLRPHMNTGTMKKKVGERHATYRNGVEKTKSKRRNDRTKRAKRRNLSVKCKMTMQLFGDRSVITIYPYIIFIITVYTGYRAEQSNVNRTKQ